MQVFSPDPAGTARLGEYLTSLTSAFAQAGLQVTFSVEWRDDHLRIELSGEDSDCFLQRKAEGLNALQHLLRRYTERHPATQDGSDVPVVLDSHGYRRMREGELREMARIGSDRVKRLGNEFSMDRLNPYERRIVHMTCQELGGVRTKSVGDGFYKRVIITSAR
ncbi:MAG: R3H domain-containing nucleic acid-binding protein [Acidobacteriota bacterium]